MILSQHWWPDGVSRPISDSKCESSCLTLATLRLRDWTFTLGILHVLFGCPIETGPRMTLNYLCSHCPCCFKDKLQSCPCDPVLKKQGGELKARGTYLCLCVCVCSKAAAGHSLLLLPYFTPLFFRKPSSRESTAPSPCCFLSLTYFSRWLFTGQSYAALV